MIYDFHCPYCERDFEDYASSNEITKFCPVCKGRTKRKFNASGISVFIPPYFHTNKSDIFSDTEWAELKKDPNVERAH